MSLTALALQGFMLVGVIALPLVPTDHLVGDVLVWSAQDAETLAAKSGAHWGGISGPAGTYVMTGSSAALRAEGALVLVNLSRLSTWCGV